MTIFKSQRVNLDREPWLCDYDIDGKPVRSFFDGHGRYTWEPRPEFEPTRDPEPWKNVYNGRRLPNTESLARLWRNGKGNRTHWVWAPRREQFDTPVNRVLVEFRECDGDPAAWLVWLDETPVGQMGVEPTLEEIDHARRVLTRLANWKEQ